MALVLKEQDLGRRWVKGLRDSDFPELRRATSSKITICMCDVIEEVAGQVVPATGRGTGAMVGLQATDIARRAVRYAVRLGWRGARSIFALVRLIYPARRSATLIQPETRAAGRFDSRPVRRDQRLCGAEPTTRAL